MSISRENTIHSACTFKWFSCEMKEIIITVSETTFTIPVLNTILNITADVTLMEEVFWIKNANYDSSETLK